MHKLLALPALLLSAYSITVVGCGGTTEPIAADANAGTAGSSAGGASGSNALPAAGATQAGGASQAGGAPSAGGPGVAGGPSEPSNTSEAGADSSVSSAIKCGDATCDPATELCYGDVGGIQPDQFQCEPIPNKCLATPTCACVVPTQPTGSCPCTDTDGVRVSCELG